MNSWHYKAGGSLVYDDKRSTGILHWKCPAAWHARPHPERERQRGRRAVENMGLQSYDASMSTSTNTWQVAPRQR
jgi:hypothetical protein